MNRETKQLLEYSIHPEGGWIRSLRNKLGITGPQLAAKLGVTKQRISALEQAERSGAASIKTMRQAAEALGCEFVYALVPKDAGGASPAKGEPLFIDPLASTEQGQCDARIVDCCHRFHISSLGIYGSAARGELTDASDVNLLAEFEAGHEPAGEAHENMEIAFGQLFGRRVAIVSNTELADSDQLEQILDDLKLLFVS